MNYPLVLVNQEKIVVEVTQPAQQLEEQVLVVLSTIKSLVIRISEVINNGSTIFTVEVQVLMRLMDTF